MQERSWVEIDLSAFASNVKALQALNSGHGYIQIVKADAYGHGSAEIARTAAQLGAVALGVANADEGALLRLQGIELPIFILSPSLPEEIPVITEYQLAPTVSDPDFALALACQNPGMGVQVEIDTGMGRSGLPWEVAPEIIQKLVETGVKLEGVFSHYAASEDDPEYTGLQKQRFNDVLARIPRPHWVHLANSGGLIAGDTGNLLYRLGIASFGVYTHPSQQQSVNLQPVMSFKTRISQVRQASPGQSLGYNRTFTVNRPLTYGILPVGYADGYSFLLSNRGSVLVNGISCPVLGKISMDMTAIDISSIPNAQPGTEVTLMGPGLEAEKLCALYQGNPYELLCQVGRRAKRYYLQQGRTIMVQPLTRRQFVPTDFSDGQLDKIIEAAVSQRLQSQEIAGLVYRNVLRRFFVQRDKDQAYRRDFRHVVEYLPAERSGFYRVRTALRFKKVLAGDHFYIACANRPEVLQRYFLRPDVEYRWLLDDNFSLESEFFATEEVLVNGLPMQVTMQTVNDCLEFCCRHPRLKELMGQELEFSIATRTYYPTKSHQLGIYITELTKGVYIEFIHNHLVKDVEVAPVFSGKTIFPEMEHRDNSIVLFTDEQEWVFPNSGVVFAY